MADFITPRKRYRSGTPEPGTPEPGTPEQRCATRRRCDPPRAPSHGEKALRQKIANVIAELLPEFTWDVVVHNGTNSSLGHATGCLGDKHLVAVVYAEDGINVPHVMHVMEIAEKNGVNNLNAEFHSRDGYVVKVTDWIDLDSGEFRECSEELVKKNIGFVAYDKNDNVFEHIPTEEIVVIDYKYCVSDETHIQAINNGVRNKEYVSSIDAVDWVVYGLK